MAALVTGGAGFIGSHVVQALLASGQEVVVLDDLSGGFLHNVPPGAVFHRVSVTDADAVAEVFARHRIQHVFHLAAYAAEGLSHFIRRFNYTNNVIGSMTLINESIRHGVECFVFTSSIAVYGTADGPMHEHLDLRPEDPYGVSKLAVELDLEAARRMFGLNFVVFRPHNVYGERQHIGDRYRNVVGIFMNQLLLDEPLTIFGTGEQKRGFTYVADVAPVIAAAATTPAAYNRVFNIGSDEAITVRDLAGRVASALGRAPRIHFLPPRMEVQEAVADHACITEVLGYRAQWSLDDGLARMAEWARHRGPQVPGPPFEVEVRRNLPPSWHVR